MLVVDAQHLRGDERAESLVTRGGISARPLLGLPRTDLAGLGGDRAVEDLAVQVCLEAERRVLPEDPLVEVVVVAHRGDEANDELLAVAVDPAAVGSLRVGEERAAVAFVEEHAVGVVLGRVETFGRQDGAQRQSVGGGFLADVDARGEQSQAVLSLVVELPPHPTLGGSAYGTSISEMDAR